MTQLVTALAPTRTPVDRIDALSHGKSHLYVKRDDRTNPIYGGNKVRKLTRILDDARSKGATRLVTIGAAGSHHVLATTVFGSQAGFEVEAILIPQGRTDHVADNLRAGIGLGLKVLPARTWLEVPLLLASRLGRGAYFIPIGGSNVLGAMGYFDAAMELKSQVDAGELPEPDLCYVTLGSGGTFAGLSAGFEAANMKTRVVGVTVSDPAWAVELGGRFLAWRLARRTCTSFDTRTFARRMETTRKYLGRGYGRPTEAGARATRIADALGLALDSTYTAKTFAAVLDALERGEERNILYWHTLSSADLRPFLVHAPAESELPKAAARLLLAPGR